MQFPYNYLGFFLINLYGGKKTTCLFLSVSAFCAKTIDLVDAVTGNFTHADQNTVSVFRKFKTFIKSKNYMNICV